MAWSTPWNAAVSSACSAGEEARHSVPACAGASATRMASTQRRSQPLRSVFIPSFLCLSSPREQGLIVVGDAGLPAFQAHLAELVEHGGGGRGDPGAADRHAKDV